MCIENPLIFMIFLVFFRKTVDKKRLGVNDSMNLFLDTLLKWAAEVNRALSDFLWSPVMLAGFLLVGGMFTVRLGFFQFRRMGLWLRETIVKALSSREARKNKDERSISQFQAMTTALAATLGTGNIVGVATAITLGGPGAIFWMWASALLGMMTIFAENVLGIHYRYRDKQGNWVGGAMIYMERGLRSKFLAGAFSVCCLVGSLGVGNMTQANAMSAAMQDSFGVPPYVTGIVAAGLAVAVILGGLKRIAQLTEKLIPFMSVLYLAAVLIVIAAHFGQIIPALRLIVREAFTPVSAGAGVLGFGISKAARYGVARGVFTNEAGLGTSVAVHANAEVSHPVIQGMWGIFEVFADTIVMCTLTALAILVSGVWSPGCGLDGGALCAASFATVFGTGGSYFISFAVMIFAFSTIIGWSFCGERCAHYLGGDKLVPLYKIAFTVIIFIGCVSRLDFVWALSDTFNGLMAVPNLIAVTALSGTVIKLTKDYFKRERL